MGCFSPDTPEPRNYGQETRDTLQAQVDLAPELYAAEAQYGPKYAALESGKLEQYLTGKTTGKSVLDLYQQDVAPTMSKLSAEAEAAQRQADVAAVEQFGGRATAAVENANPSLKALTSSIDAQIAELLGRGDSIAPSDKRDLEQSIRSAQAARGLGYGNADALAELIGLDRAKEARQTSRLGTAMSWAGQKRQASVDPFLAILGRASSTPALSTGVVNAGQATSTGARNSIFNPESAYASDVFNTNYNAEAAANIAGANNIAGITGALLGTGAQIGKSMIGLG